MRCIIIGILLCLSLAAKELRVLDFELIKKNISPTPTLLIIGGIQGDEPGGFNTTNIFLNHYTIKNGSVWVVPVLNPHSMLRNHRGIYGDMNRKFAKLDPNDKEAFVIAHIKEVIRQKEVSAILHLHDGSGYFRTTYENALLNPNRWGNCTIIDQKDLAGVQFGELEKNALTIIEHINTHILKPLHRYHLRNTQTAQLDKEMQKALTFYAINQGKPAYANEASKELPVAERVFYHLLAIEALLTRMGIGFERDFELTPQQVQAVINNPKQTFSIEGMPFMPLFGLRASQTNFPLPKGKDFGEIHIESSNKILGLLPKENLFLLKYGNNVMTRLQPYTIEFGTQLEPFKARIDNKEQQIRVGTTIQVAESVDLESLRNAANASLKAHNQNAQIRINVVGLANQKANTLTKAMLNPNASLDTKANLYRLEFYTRTEIPQETPQPTAPQQEINKLPPSTDNNAQVQVNLAHVRAEPSIDSAIIAKAPMGRKVLVIGKMDSPMGAWAQVEYDFYGRKVRGYILERLLYYGGETTKNPNTTKSTPPKPRIKEVFSGMVVLDFSAPKQ